MEDPIWLSGRVPKEFWKNREHRRWYLAWLGEQLGYQTPEDWYQLTRTDFKTYHGASLLAAHYQNSPAAAVQEYLPKYDWREWLFVDPPRAFWQDAENRRRYMAWLGTQLGYQTPEDWYHIRGKDFTLYHGAELLRDYYQGSLFVAVKECFPEHAWQEWLFLGDDPKTFWQNAEHRRRYMAWLGEQLGYHAPADWYRLTANDVEVHQGRGLLDYYHNSALATVLDAFPDDAWQPEKFALAQQRQQQLARLIEKIFAGYDVHTEVPQADTRPAIVIPALHLAIACQGEQHALPIALRGRIAALKKIQRRDKAYWEICQKQGTILIEIPHSWDGDEDAALELLLLLFVKQVNTPRKWPEHIRAVLAALTAYRQKQRRRHRPENPTTNPKQLSFLP